MKKLLSITILASKTLGKIPVTLGLLMTAAVLHGAECQKEKTTAAAIEPTLAQRIRATVNLNDKR
jgi:hypothetical protein